MPVLKKPDPERIDKDNPELDDAWFARARPAKEVLPPELYAALTDKSKPPVITIVSDAEDAVRHAKKRGGRPPLPATKRPTTIRLDPLVMDRFKATGKGWQTRINAILREAVEQGRV